ncbi:MAG: FtsW/RodA/SpoVE family cell cycle protein [Clostridia bacterium]|nr:FtsW/RodA/SpoVE family cell cycle protein [Clostridia bacterium]
MTRKRIPVLCLILVNLLSYGLLAMIVPQNAKALLIQATILVVLNASTYLVISRFFRGDPFLFLISSMLVSVGMVMLSRIDATGGTDYARRQMLWFLIGIAVFYLSFFIYLNVSALSKLLWVYLGLSYLLFVVTLVFGTAINGAKNWITLGGFSVQPSELIKVLFVFFLAAAFANVDKLRFKNLDGKWMLSILSYAFFGFLVLQREWGSALVYFLVYACLCYHSGFGFLFLLINAFPAGLAGFVGAKVLPHIQTRIAIWQDPWVDPTVKGWQIIQSMLAINAGGFLGVGIGRGSPESVPESYSDAIFSLICEELGIFGGIAVVLLFFILVYRGLKIALKTKNTFDRTVALGLTLLFGFQSFIIIGGMIKLIPLTGVTLPFISYGGTSLLISFFQIGVLSAIAQRSLQTKKEDAA